MQLPATGSQVCPRLLFCGPWGGGVEPCQPGEGHPVLRDAQVHLLNNPEKVRAEQDALVGQFKDRGLSLESFRGPKGTADVPLNPQRGTVKTLRSPIMSWAPFVLNGQWN